MSEALNHKELQFLIALWIEGDWVALPGEMKVAVSGLNSKSPWRLVALNVRSAKRLHKFGYVETIAPSVIMNMMTGKHHKVPSNSFRITKLGIMRLTDPKHVLINEVMEE